MVDDPFKEIRDIVIGYIVRVPPELWKSGLTELERQDQVFQSAEIKEAHYFAYGHPICVEDHEREMRR